MRIAYLDVFAGISGDMTLGALVDAGVELEAVRAELAKIPMHGWRLEAEKTTRGGICGTRVHVREDGGDGGPGPGHGDHPGHGRPCRELVEMVEASSLEEPVRRQAVALLWRVAEAEAKVHGTTPQEVHFHELGGLDSIVDIVGAVVGFRLLGVEEIVCSPLPISHGFVESAHGRLPVPAPATVELLRGVPTFSLDVEGETVTPTGALIAVGLAGRFGWFPGMAIEAIGHGCGSKDFRGVPNVLRLVVGQRSGPMPGLERGQGTWAALIADRILLLETNLDDMNPELFPRVMQRAFEAGAADVWMSPVYMKKGRPGTQLSALAGPEQVEAVVAAILTESTTFGVRLSTWERRCLPREKRQVQTPFGSVSVKIGKIGDRVVTVAPEYEDCAAAAERVQVSVKEVYSAALAAAREPGAP